MSVTVPDAQGEVITYVPVSTFGALLIQAMQPWVQTNAFCWYLDAIGVMVDPLYSMVADVGEDGDAGYVSGYGSLFNPTTTQAADLPYLAQYVGVQVPRGADATTARSLVLAEAGMSRGTDAAVIAAAKRTLTGTQTVYYFRRTFSDGKPNAGWAGLGVLASECASLAATAAAVNAVKMGGVMTWIELVASWTVGAMESAEATVGAMEAAFVSISGMEGDIPGA